MIASGVLKYESIDSHSSFNPPVPVRRTVGQLDTDEEAQWSPATILPYYRRRFHNAAVSARLGARFVGLGHHCTGILSCASDVALRTAHMSRISIVRSVCVPLAPMGPLALQDHHEDHEGTSGLHHSWKKGHSHPSCPKFCTFEAEYPLASLAQAERS